MKKDPLLSRLFPIFWAACYVAGCGDAAMVASQDADSRQHLAQQDPDQVIVAVMGDYGTGSAAEGRVAGLINTWKPDFIVTTGDNNYPVGAASTLDDHIGRYYHAYILFGPTYRGRYRGMGADRQAFFPTLGNHDWLTARAGPYLRYFDLPGNKRYYRVARGPVEFFLLDSDVSEPDGVRAAGAQGQWLKSALATSEARWKLVAFHHPPYSTGWHGGAAYMRWPFKAWGADAVFTGHDHHYERIVKDGLPYIVCGTGGAALRGASGRHGRVELDVVYTRDHGAVRVQADANALNVGFYNTSQVLIDDFSL